MCVRKSAGFQYSISTLCSQNCFFASKTQVVKVYVIEETHKTIVKQRLLMFFLKFPILHSIINNFL